MALYLLKVICFASLYLTIMDRVPTTPAQRLMQHASLVRLGHHDKKMQNITCISMASIHLQFDLEHSKTRSHVNYCKKLKNRYDNEQTSNISKVYIRNEVEQRIKLRSLKNM